MVLYFWYHIALVRHQTVSYGDEGVKYGAEGINYNATVLYQDVPYCLI